MNASRLAGVRLCLRAGGSAAFAAAALLATQQEARANVYAAHLSASATNWNFSNGPLSISYRLNEPATSVTVQIYRASDPNTVIKTLVGTTAYGLNTIQWDGTDDNGIQVPAAGDYKFRVIAEDSVGHATWTNITPLVEGNEIGDAQFYAPQGIAVNRDPSSPYFGYVYISSGESNLASTNPGASAVGDGLFILHNDLSFRGGSAATAAAAANAFLATSSSSNLSPWKININQDNPDEIVMTDFLDNFEDVYIFNGDGTEVRRILNRETSGPTTGENYNHSNAISAALTGVGENRKLWVIDEDKDIGAARVTGGFDLIRFDIGTTLENYMLQGVEVKNGGATTPGTPFVTNFYTGRDLQFGRLTGTSRVYIACRRANDANGNIAVVCYTLDENGIVNGAVWVTENPAVRNAIGVPWMYSSTLAIDEAHNRGAVGRDLDAGARVVIFDTNDGSVLTSFTTSSNGSSFRGLDFDAAGNLYTSNQSDEHVRVWSPPDGPNSFTTDYYGTLSLNCPVPPPTILEQPGNIGKCAGQSATFTVVADGHGFDLTYTWRRGTTVLASGPSNTYTIDPVGPGDAGTYTVTITGCGSTESAPFTLSVSPSCLPDYTGDGLVNSADFNVWLPCATRDKVPATPECLNSSPPKDFDGDGDIDLDDFAKLQRCMAGNVPPNPNCVD